MDSNVLRVRVEMERDERRGDGDDFVEVGGKVEVEGEVLKRVEGAEKGGWNGFPAGLGRVLTRSDLAQVEHLQLRRYTLEVGVGIARVPCPVEVGESGEGELAEKRFGIDRRGAGRIELAVVAV